MTSVAPAPAESAALAAIRLPEGPADAQLTGYVRDLASRLRVAQAMAGRMADCLERDGAKDFEVYARTFDLVVGEAGEILMCLGALGSSEGTA